MSLKTALFTINGIILSLFIILSASYIYTTDLLDTEAQQLVDAGESISLAKNLKSKLLTHNRYSFLYSLHKSPKRLEGRQQQRFEINKHLIELRRLVNSEDETTLLKQVKNDIYTYFEKRDQLNTSKLSPVEQYIKASILIDSLEVSVDKLIQINRSQLNTLIASVNKQNKIADRLAVSLLAIGAIIILLITAGIIWAVYRPLMSLSKVIAKYKAGNTQIRAEKYLLKEINALSENFNLMANSIDEKQRDQLQFIASIAHDLRNPLNSISMASEMLLDKHPNTTHATIISNQTKHLDRLVSDLLDTARIESGQLDLTPQACDIKKIIKDSIELYQLSSSIHKLKLSLPDYPLICKCDASRISQVINNLISNAIKYSPNGGTIQITAIYETNDIIISIQDQGIGIAEQDQVNIFKPFHRTKSTKGTIPGIGLGLSSSKKIIEHHQGKLKVESQAGHGSIFKIILPAMANTQYLDKAIPKSKLNYDLQP